MLKLLGNFLSHGNIAHVIIRLTNNGFFSQLASLGVISNPVGALLGGVLVDVVGRKTTLQAIVIPSLVGWITIALSRTFIELCVGRLVTGFTIGE